MPFIFALIFSALICFGSAPNQFFSGFKSLSEDLMLSHQARRCNASADAISCLIRVTDTSQNIKW